MIADRTDTAVILQFTTMPKTADFTPDNRLRELRLARGLKLRHIGEAIGTTPTHVQRLEIGGRDLTKMWMKAIARVLEVLPADLFLADEGGLSAEERRVIDTLRQVPAANRAAILGFIQSQQPWRASGELVQLDSRDTA